MKKLLALLLLASPVYAGIATYGLNQYSSPSSCGTNGQFLSTNGNCALAWSTQSAPTTLLSSTNTWVANQTFGPTKITIGGFESPNLYLKIDSGGYGTMYFGTLSGNRGIFDGGGNPSLTISDNGNIATGATSPDSSAQLEVKSTVGGLLFPRMTTTQKNAISSPKAGLVVYDTSLGKLSVYTGAGWETVTSL